MSITKGYVNHVENGVLGVNQLKNAFPVKMVLEIIKESVNDVD